MKRSFLVVVLISLLPIVSLFATADLPHTHDGLVHLPRIAAYFKALGDSQIPVRWAGDLNYGYGMPLFNFIYQLPYFIASVFLFLGTNLATSFKLTLALSYVSSGIFMYAFSQAFFKDKYKAFLVTIFYQFAPFRLVELLIRGSFGEVYAYAFLPLVLFGLVRRNFTLTSVAAALLVLSHNSVSLLFFAVVVIFALFFVEKRFWPKSGLSLICGLSLSAFYWVPALFEHKYTYGDLFMKNLYIEHFGPIWKFFIPNFLNNPNLQIGGVSVQIGLFHVIAFILSIIIIKKLNKATRRIVIFCLSISTIALFFTQPLSKIFWENISLLRQFQFPWRFLSIIVFATSMLSISFLSFSWFKKKAGFIALIALVVFSTSYYWRTQLGVDKIDSNYYFNFPLNTTYYGETDVIWSAGPKNSYPKDRVEVISQEAEILEFAKKSNLHTFTVVNSGGEATLVDHTQYFPGWRVSVDGKSIPIEFQDPNWRGEIEFKIPTGKHSVRVAFGETKLRLVSDIISLSTLIMLMVMSFLKKRSIFW